MKVVQINATSSGSTGKIARDISFTLAKSGIENYFIFSQGSPKSNSEIKIGNPIITFFNNCLSHITGKYGFVDYFNTRALLKKIDRINPNIVHIHNIHSHVFNLSKLINHLKDKNIKVVWTFHDCWAYTGGCTYFDFTNCQKWKTECCSCPQKSKFSLLFDASRDNFRKKVACLNKNIVIVCPSLWMQNLVKMSFLKNQNSVVINNGIDSQIYRFDHLKAHNFATKYRIDITKKIVLSVAFSFTKRKGVDDIFDIARRMGSDYLFVLIGELPKKKKILENMLHISRTDNQDELVGAYSLANVFLNTTYEDNYPTVHLEALSCNLPIVTYDSGGSKESMFGFGKIVEKGNISAAIDAIISVINSGKQSFNKPRIELIESKKVYLELLELYTNCNN